MPVSDPLPLSSIVSWADCMEDYARDWDKTFDFKAHYFTQEYWYLLVTCTVSHWKNHPLNITSACGLMKSGSMRTREERIKKACIDGYLVKEAATNDHRHIVIKPTAKLEKLIREHLERTLKHALSIFNSQ